MSSSAHLTKLLFDEPTVLARIPNSPAGAKSTIPNAIRGEFAILTTDTPVRSIAELEKAGALAAVEFADGMRLSLQGR
jgi:hypothetical protein